MNGILSRREEAWGQAGIRNAAVLVLDVDSGNPLAYAGNIPGDGPGRAVDIIHSVRSTGSLLKPFLYASMLDAGELLPAQLVADIPTRIGGFQPENNSKSYAGAVPASVALAHSLNVPAVRLLRSHGLDRFAEELRGLGLSSLDRPASSYGLTLVLGGAEGSLGDLTRMYAGLARSAKGLPGFDIGEGACWLTLTALLEVERTGRGGGLAGLRRVEEDRVEDGHQLRLSRRVGDRGHAALRGGRVGRQCQRRGTAGPEGIDGRGARALRRVRPAGRLGVVRRARS